MKNYKVSVIVFVYNASWERIRATLNSVILQKDIDFEVIVADDCSQNNYFDKIKDFFTRYSFTDYRLIAHKKNLGIVLNFLDAAKKAKSNYVRGLGQGDMFFDEYALRDSYNHISQKKAVLTASKIVAFHVGSNPIKLKKLTRCPQNIAAYDDPKLVQENVLMLRDRPSGASIMYERETLIGYLTEMSNLLGGGLKTL